MFQMSLSHLNMIDSSEDKPVTEFEPRIENGEQEIVKDNKLLSTNFAID